MAKQNRINSIAWHLRWLVRTRADISLRPSCQSNYLQFKIGPCSYECTWPQLEIISCSYQFAWSQLDISVLGLTNPLGHRLISALVLTSHLKCQAKLLILLCLAAPFLTAPGCFCLLLFVINHPLLKYL